MCDYVRIANFCIIIIIIIITNIILITSIQTLLRVVQSADDIRIVSYRKVAGPFSPVDTDCQRVHMPSLKDSQLWLGANEWTNGPEQEWLVNRIVQSSLLTTV